MTYKRVTFEERRLIHRWGQEGCSIREISRRLGRSPSSISREIRRNTGVYGYRHKQAHEKAQERTCRPVRRRFTAELKEEVERFIRIGWTPEMISGRARLEGRAWVCKETIYTYLYADAKAGGDLWQCLPRSHRKRKRRCPRMDGRGRGRIPNQRMIDSRPIEVETRATIGHWECDLINGAAGTGNLVTAVERCSRFSLVGRTNTKEAEEVTKVLSTLLLQVPQKARSGGTFDNGKEFAKHEELARLTEMDVFFAHPYHSWERGTNENTNGLVRRVYPKNTSFALIGEEELEQIERYLNDRPKKCLGWKTPREVMNAFLASAP